MIYDHTYTNHKISEVFIVMNRINPVVTQKYIGMKNVLKLIQNLLNIDNSMNV